MSSRSDTIDRLRKKRISIEQTYGHVPMTGLVDTENNNSFDGGNNGMTRNAMSPSPPRPTTTTTTRTNTSNTFNTSILEHITYLESKVKALELLEERLKEVEKKTIDDHEEEKVDTNDVDDDDKQYPKDCYSLIALNGPSPTLLWYELWPEQKSFGIFLFGMSVFLFQSAFHYLMLSGDFEFGGKGPMNDNSDPVLDFFESFIPKNPNRFVVAAQILALVAFVVFPDATVQDLVIAFKFFPRCMCRSVSKDDPIWTMRFSCILRGVRAILGIANAWVLVMASNTVLEIILSLAAINFISNISRHAFSLAQNGVLGPALKVETCERIVKTKLPLSMYRKDKHVAYRIGIFCIGMILWGFMIAVLMGYDESDPKVKMGVRRLGDGICDEDLNHPGFSYDGGDCCAATCTGPNCGKEIFSNVFGNADVSGTGFPTCIDPDDMVPLTINLNSIASSRQFVDTSTLDFVSSTEDQWKSETPAPTYFSLNCEGKTILTVDIDPSMVDNAETVMVKDGASCSLVVKNSTQSIDTATPIALSNTDFVTPEPIWYIDYTLFHGEKSEGVEILSQASHLEGSVSFGLVPTCYLEELEVDAAKLYKSSSGSSNNAIGWLIQDNPEISQCGDDGFMERYALVNMNFALQSDASEIANFINRDDHCTWPSITCRGGQVDTVALGFQNLKGEIPSEIGLMTNLKKLQLNGNQISSIPTEIGLLTSVEELFLSYNEITSVPSQIGLMSSLQSLTLAGNSLSSIPSEIGLLTGLQELHLYGNELLSIPTEIGNMSSLQKLSLNGNRLKSIPSEIGHLTGLQELLLFDNDDLFVTIPKDVQLLTSSYNLTVYENDITCDKLPGGVSEVCFYSL